VWWIKGVIHIKYPFCHMGELTFGHNVVLNIFRRVKGLLDLRVKHHVR
jgi:hypothetical protein